MENNDILIVGVGGQGTLLASRIIGRIACDAGKDVKLSEVHGMAQRGGSVVTYVRIGEDIQSPLIERGGADIIVAFEKLEALRWLDYLKAGGKIIVNEQEILPMPVITGAAEYPENIMEQLNASCEVIALDALKLAGQAGNKKCVNTVLLGVAARLIGESFELWENAVSGVVPEKTREINKAAFKLGYEFVR